MTEKKKTKPQIEIDLAEVEKYAQVCDSEEEIAMALGISYSTLQNRKRDFVDFKRAIKKGKAKANVFVGGKLMEAVREGNITATIFYLKSRCGWKETNRTELTGKDGGAIETKAEQDLTEEQLKEELGNLGVKKNLFDEDEEGNSAAGGTAYT